MHYNNLLKEKHSVLKSAVPALINYFVTDIDGTLTDGKIYMGPNGELAKAFSVKDGYALSVLLKNANIKPIVITGRTSSIVSNRCKELGIELIAQGVTDKIEKLIELIGKDDLDKCAYFGDDILDLDCMKPIKNAGGIVVCPADAISDVKAIADYVCVNRAGEGAAREAIEWLTTEQPNQDEINERITRGIKEINGLITRGADYGSYSITDWLKIEIKDVVTTDPASIHVESHRKHADIQWVIEGDEAIDVAPTSSLVSKTPYENKTDTELWYPRPCMTRIQLGQGSYIVLYPGDAHRPCIDTDGTHKTIKVAIGKVALGNN